MTSEQYVWAWLPGASTPVVCGLVREEAAGTYSFNYGVSYLSHPDAIPLFGMPLTQGLLPLPDGLIIHGALRDALPDAWGQRVILNKITGLFGRAADTGDLSLMTYMRESGSDRFGALDFQDSATDYVERNYSATLEDLATAADALEEGLALPPALDAALAHGTSIGGARPKVTLTDGDQHWIAKLSSSSDRRPAVRHEALALELARHMGVEVVESSLTTVLGRDVLLVRRFDRGPNGLRSMAVSALTLVGLDEMTGRYATYPDLLDALRTHGSEPEHAGRELFHRIAANIALGNTDDHARNHAALWDGKTLTLSPAYDIDPCRPHGWDANQAMAYGRKGERVASLRDLAMTAPIYGLSRAAGLEIARSVLDAIHENWTEACDAARLPAAESERMMGRTVLNPSVIDGL